MTKYIQNNYPKYDSPIFSGNSVLCFFSFGASAAVLSTSKSSKSSKSSVKWPVPCPSENELPDKQATPQPLKEAMGLCTSRTSHASIPKSIGLGLGRK